MAILALLKTVKCSDESNDVLAIASPPIHSLPHVFIKKYTAAHVDNIISTFSEKEEKKCDSNGQFSTNS